MAIKKTNTSTTKKTKTTKKSDKALENAVANIASPPKKKTTVSKNKAKAEEPKKETKKKNDPIKDAVALAATQKTVINKPLKYVYPKGCIDSQARKSHRQKIRKQNLSFLAKIASAKVKDKKELKAKYDEFCKINFAAQAV